MYLSVPLLVASVLASARCAFAASPFCDEYVSTLSQPQGLAILADLNSWDAKEITRRLLNDVKKQFLNGRNVSMYGCVVPIDDIRCHHENMLPVTQLQLPGPLPSLKASGDFECFQGLMSTSHILDVELPITNGTSFDGNFTVRFSGLRAGFTLKVSTPELELPSKVGPIPLPPIKLPAQNEQAPLHLQNISLSVTIPISGHCKGHATHFNLNVGKIKVRDLELDVSDVHPVASALNAPVDRICSQLGQADTCRGITSNLDSKASQGLEYELVHMLPSMLADELSAVFADVAKRQQIPCLPPSLRDVVGVVDRMRSGDGNATVKYLVGVLVALPFVLSCCLCLSWALKATDPSASKYGGPLIGDDSSGINQRSMGLTVASE